MCEPAALSNRPKLELGIMSQYVTASFIQYGTGPCFPSFSLARTKSPINKRKKRSEACREHGRYDNPRYCPMRHKRRTICSNSRPTVETAGQILQVQANAQLLRYFPLPNRFHLPRGQLSKLHPCLHVLLTSLKGVVEERNHTVLFTKTIIGDMKGSTLKNVKMVSAFRCPLDK